MFDFLYFMFCLQVEELLRSQKSSNLVKMTEHDQMKTQQELQISEAKAKQDMAIKDAETKQKLAIEQAELNQDLQAKMTKLQLELQQL